MYYRNLSSNEYIFNLKRIEVNDLYDDIHQLKFGYSINDGSGLMGIELNVDDSDSLINLFINAIHKLYKLEKFKVRYKNRQYNWFYGQISIIRMW